MKASMESTETIVELDGARQARLWTGVTDGGVAFQALVVRVAVAKGADQSEFQRALEETPAPAPEAVAFPLRSSWTTIWRNGWTTSAGSGTAPCRRS